MRSSIDSLRKKKKKKKKPHGKPVRRFRSLIWATNTKMWCKKEVEGSMEGRLYRVLATLASWRWEECMPCARGKCWKEDEKQDMGGNP